MVSTAFLIVSLICSSEDADEDGWLVGKIRRLYVLSLVQHVVCRQTSVVTHNTVVHYHRFEEDPTHVVAHFWMKRL